MKLPLELQRLLTEIGTSLNNYATNDPKDPNFLGEPWRSHLLELKGQINASLEALPPTDQAPAANEAHWGLMSLQRTLLGVQSIINALKQTVQSKNGEIAAAHASVSGLVDSGVQAKLTSGEYVSKVDAENLAKNARTEGETAGFNRGKLLADRRSALAVAGLPVEVAGHAPEAILLGEEKEFNAARDAAKDRVTKLSGIGLTVASASMLSLPWEKQEAFDAQFLTFEQIAKGKGSSTNSNTPPAAKPNGFIGGSGRATEPSALKPAFSF